MSLPLPRVVADVGPGGPLVTSMRGINALSNEMLDTQINRIKKQYAPISAQAEAASKLAYANLMGPQFLAKLLGNDAAVANMGDDAARAALQKAVGAGMGQGSGMNAFNQMQQGGQGQGGQQSNGLFSGIGQPSTNSFSGYLQNSLKSLLSLFGKSGQQQASNPFAPSATQGQANAPAEYASPPAPRNNASPRPPGGVSVEGEQWYDKNGNPVYGDELEQATEPSINLELNKGQRQPSYAEKTGTYKGIVEEGQESGKIRAKDIEGLNNAVFNSETNQQTLDDVADILASPTFENIRQTPLAGHHELAYYAKEGTPEEQQMVGKFYTLTGNLIKDASRDFAGQFRKGEQQLLNGMKPGPSDTVDSAKGKVESLSVLNKMLAQRSRLTSQLMSEYHINKLQASDMADKKVNGQAIRKEVHDRLNPTVTIRNNKTGETRTLSVSEARKLGVPNV